MILRSGYDSDETWIATIDAAARLGRTALIVDGTGAFVTRKQVLETYGDTSRDSGAGGVGRGLAVSI